MITIASKLIVPIGVSVVKTICSFGPKDNIDEFILRFRQRRSQTAHSVSIRLAGQTRQLPTYFQEILNLRLKAQIMPLLGDNYAPFEIFASSAEPLICSLQYKILAPVKSEEVDQSPMLPMSENLTHANIVPTQAPPILAQDHIESTQAPPILAQDHIESTQEIIESIQRMDESTQAPSILAQDRIKSTREMIESTREMIESTQAPPMMAQNHIDSTLVDVIDPPISMIQDPTSLTASKINPPPVEEPMVVDNIESPSTQPATIYTCPRCRKTCKTSGGLTRHMKIH
jgi:hypothetical protein